MTSVLLDTVGLIAVWDVDDQWHAAAENAYQRIISQRQRALTTTFIFWNAATQRLDVPFGVMSVLCDRCSL
jgi:predicted nucleic acid-binding protein